MLKKAVSIIVIFMIFLSGISVVRTEAAFVRAFEEIPQSETNPISVMGISIDKFSIVFERIGQKVKLNASVLPADADNKKIIWSSGDKNIVSVDQTGLVTAVGNGAAIITATTEDGGYTANCWVTVNDYRDTVIGIDVSEHQGAINWAKVKAAGVEFAIIRVGYRGYESGKMVLDKYFLRNIKGATENGIEVGVYFFSQAITINEGINEAKMVLNYIKDYKITYPIAYDTEHIPDNTSRANRLSPSKRTDIALAFCNTIQQAQYKPVVYSCVSFLENSLQLERLKDIDIWVARYDGSMYHAAENFIMWQFSSSGYVSGIYNRVDINIYKRSRIIEFSNYLKPINGLTVSSEGFNSVKIKWRKITAADEYQIYRATKKYGTYKKVKETNKLYFTDKNLRSGTTYYYKMRAIRNIYSTKLYGKYSGIKSITPKLRTPPNFRLEKISGTALKLTWGKVVGATGYEILRTSSVSGNFKVIKRTTILNFKNKGLKKGKIYYYKVRAYRIYGKTRIYSGDTNVVGKKM